VNVNERIAVVDDDVSVCKGLTRLLRSAGYTAVAFSSAEECQESRDLDAIRCFLVDIHLGGVNGLALARNLRAEGILAPIIFMTAEDESRTREVLRDAGSPLCLAKPMDSATVLDAIAARLPRV
jgi:FixJ family two-component response regulator